MPKHPLAANAAPAPEALPHSDTSQLNAIKDLEIDLCDVVAMTDVASDVVTEALAKLDEHRALAGGKPDFFYIPAAVLNRILFTARHANEMAQALECKFFAIVEHPIEGTTDE